MKRPWTILVYLSSDNSLSTEMVWSLQEIQRAGLDDEVAVLAQFDSPVLGVGTVRFDFSGLQGEVPYLPVEQLRLSDFVVRTWAEATAARGVLLGPEARVIPVPVAENFAAPETLMRFLREAMARCPAEQLFLVLSGFGNGFTAGMFQDDHPGAQMSLPQLATALASAGTIDLLGLDACLLGMVELAAELRGTVKYLVASAGTTPISGWPYYQILSVIKAQPQFPAVSVGQAVLREFLDFYEDYAIAGVSVDQALIDVEASAAVEVAVAQLVAALTTEQSDVLTLRSELVNAMVLAHYNSQSYRYEQHADLWDFCYCLEQQTTDVAVRAACAAVILSVQGCVVRAGSAGVAFQHSHGLSIYFPWAMSQAWLISEYKGLAFSQRTKWGAFLGAYVTATQRVMRGPQFSGQAWIFPPDWYFTRDNPQLGSTRDNPQLGSTRDNPQLGSTRDNPQLGSTRDLTGTAGFVVPPVKNPPDHYYRES